MSGPRPGAAVQGPLLVSVIALCVLGTAAVFPGAGYVPAFAYAFAAAVATRLLVAPRGRALLPRHLRLPLGYGVAAACGAFLLQRLGARGSDSLWTLMCVTSVFQALVLLWRQTTFSSFLLILFSSVHAAGIAFAQPDESALAFIAAYVALLVWCLMLFERQAALERGTEDEGGMLRARAKDGRALPLRPVLRATLTLVCVGLPLGALFYLAVPRGLNPWSLPRADSGAADAEDGRAAADGPSRPATGRTPFSVTGPGGSGGAPLGSVAEIKRNFEPWFEVGLGEEGGMPPTVILRDNAQDFYDPRGVWTDTISSSRPPALRRDMDDGRPDGRIPLEHVDRRGGIPLRIEVLRGGASRLYLQPDEAEVAVLRDGKPPPRLAVRERLNKTFDVSAPLRAGDVILQRYLPPVQDDRVLETLRSDPSVAPLTSYLQVPVRCEGPLRARAQQVVGSERGPWRRARKLEAWLRSEAFTYSLKIPALDPRDPVVDFVERTRTANCEAFAYALTLMLRTLGHPTRYVRGFWGGDRQEQRGTVILRGVHYHAWTEMYLEGAGWIALNPTPPDRTAVDAGTLTAAKEAWEERRAETEEPDWSFLGYDAAGWRAFWRGVARRLDAWVLEPLGALFAPRTGYVGVPLLLLALLWLRRRRERARLRRMVSPAGGSLPRGAYGEALLLLARKGIRRRANQTVREYLRHVRHRVPGAAEALGRLSLLHEAVRYGGGSEAGARAEGQAALAALRRSLTARSTGHSEVGVPAEPGGS